MTSLDELAIAVRDQAKHYRRCSSEQALVYGCEDVVERYLPSRILENEAIEQFVEEVCDAEGVDVPIVRVGSERTAVVGSADLDEESIRLARRPSAATVLHELAHLISGVDGHGQGFRDEYVRLTRRHGDVQRASLVHRLFATVGLAVGPWAASAR